MPILVNREFVMLSKDYKDQIGDYFVSEKLDGMRAIWVPGTRGKVCFNDTRVGSGLWSRYGKVINFPVDHFPGLLDVDFLLDGELWSGRGTFNATISACKKITPISSEWEAVKFKVFDSPNPTMFCTPGKIHNNVWKGMFDFKFEGIVRNISQPYLDFIKWPSLPGNVERHDQQRMFIRGLDQVKEYFAKYPFGTEGLMFRRGIWEPKRSGNLLKYKPFTDDEATIIQGNVTSTGTGSVKVQWRNQIFDLAGFDYKFRESGQNLAGRVVTFRYNGITPEGNPREARFLRFYAD